MNDKLPRTEPPNFQVNCEGEGLTLLEVLILRNNVQAAELPGDSVAVTVHHEGRRSRTRVLDVDGHQDLLVDGHFGGESYGQDLGHRRVRWKLLGHGRDAAPSAIALPLRIHGVWTRHCECEHDYRRDRGHGTTGEVAHFDTAPHGVAMLPKQRVCRIQSQCHRVVTH